MIGGVAAPLFSGPQLLSRTAFLAELSAILGANQRLLYLPNGTDTTTSVESSTVGSTITWDATIAARVSRQGNGYAQSWTGTQYGDIADTANLTFGNGTADQALTALALVNPTTTGSTRTVMSKFGATSTGEYRLAVLNDGRVQWFQTDASAAVNVNRLTTSGAPDGAWSLVGVTNTGTGGAAAMDTVTIYRNAVVMASSATNNASYVAMEDQVSPFELGTQQTHIAPFAGSLALAVLTQKALTAAEHAAVASLCSRFFGLSL